MTQITWSSHPLLFASFQDFQKNDSFLKNVLNVLEAKKVDYIFEKPRNLYSIVFLDSFFSFLLWIPAESLSNLKKLFKSNHRLRWNTTLQICKLHLIFFSKTTVMWVIFWNEDDICIIISDCRNWFKDKLKKLINKQIIFYSPSRCNLPYYFWLQKLIQK